jgi:hypothetical protein
MNIYIRADIEKDLRKEKSMSGLINRLLADYFKGNADYHTGGDKIKPKKVKKIEVPEKNVEKNVEYKFEDKYQFEEYMDL